MMLLLQIFSWFYTTNIVLKFFIIHFASAPFEWIMAERTAALKAKMTQHKKIQFILKGL